MLDTSNVSISTSDVEESSRRRSIFYVSLSESLENYLPPSPADCGSPKSPNTPPYVSTPAPARFLLKARKSISKSPSISGKDSQSMSKTKVFNTFPTKAPPKNLGLSKCSSDIDFSEIEPKMNTSQEGNILKLSLPAVQINGSHTDLDQVSKSQSDLSSVQLVKVQAKEIEVCKSPLKNTLSCGTAMAEMKNLLKKERSFIGLSTSKSASRINLTISEPRSSRPSILSAPKIFKSNSKNNVSVIAVENQTSTDKHNLPQNTSKSSSGSSLFLSPSKGDLSLSVPDKPKGFSLIRRSHSTKLTRSNSLLKPFIKPEQEDIDGPIVDLCESDYFSELLKQYDESGGKLNLVDGIVYGTLVHGGTGVGMSPMHARKSTIRSCLDTEEEAVHSGIIFKFHCDHFDLSMRIDLTLNKHHDVSHS